MIYRRYSALLTMGTLALAIVACAGGATIPTLSNVRMTTNDTGETPTSSYTPSSDFYVFADLENLKAGSVIQAKCFAVDAEGVEANSEITTTDYSYESGVKYVYFQLSPPGGGVSPAGSYRVELYLDGTKMGEQSYTVR
jgi:hypothetical protein